MMAESLDGRAKRVFDSAIESSGAERVALLERACAGDGELRERVERLLSAAERDDDFLREPTLGGANGTAGASAEERAGAMIGPYRVLSLIGEGGFGSVYLAEQLRPVHRRVALKIIKLGMDTRAVVARFEQERQALALMEHPNIAKVLDAGATASGRPYFVMELVLGRPITSYCDERGLTIPERLELFREVCLAVHHAHTKGIIHRDIKPGNVLVVEQDGRATCRVIDFGIAKATARPLTEKTLFTEFRQLVGTPEYMSPEQAAGSMDIDTRSDVYSLGVLLYELLSGTTPLDARRLRSAAFGEMQRMIREEDPPAPSTRVSAIGPEARSVAAQRRTEPRRLGTMIRGELDWMVMRALEKERGRRYDSAGGLAADIARFLDGSPVEAAPATTGYRVRTFVRRHRGGVAAAGMVTVALVAGLAATMWQARAASRERDAARSALAVAERRGKETEQVSRFQAAQLASIDPRAMGLKVRADILETVEGVMLRDGATPEQIASRREEVQRVLGDVNFTDVAMKTLGRTFFDRALAAARKEFADQPLVRAEILLSIGGTMGSVGLGSEAVGPLREAMAIRRGELGDDHRQTIAALSTLGQNLVEAGSLEEGGRLLREANERAERTLGPDDALTLLTRNNVGLMLFRTLRLEEAERLFRGLIVDQKRVRGTSVETAKAINNLAVVLNMRGRNEEAVVIWNEAVEMLRQTLGEDDGATLQAEINLALNELDLPAPSNAMADLRSCVDRVRRRYGDGHPETVVARLHLAQALLQSGSTQDAERIAREIAEGLTRQFGPDHSQTLEVRALLGRCLYVLGRAEEAAACLRDTLARQTARFGADSLPATMTRMSLGDALTDLGDYAGAAEELLRVERVLGASGHGSVDGLHKSLAELYEAWNQAEPSAERARLAREHGEARGK